MVDTVNLSDKIEEYIAPPQTNVSFQAGVGSGVIDGAQFKINAGAGDPAGGNGGPVNIRGGQATNGTSGYVRLAGRDTVDNGAGGSAEILGGWGAGAGDGGRVNIEAGWSGWTSGTAGYVRIVTGSTQAANGDGGDLKLVIGAKAGSGRNGLIIIEGAGLPTSDPSVAGALWNDTGTLKISAG